MKDAALQLDHVSRRAGDASHARFALDLGQDHVADHRRHRADGDPAAAQRAQGRKHGARIQRHALPAAAADDHEPDDQDPHRRTTHGPRTNHSSKSTVSRPSAPVTARTYASR